MELSRRSERLRQGSGEREAELGLTLPLWRAGQRAVRIDAAEAGIAAARAEMVAARLRLAGEVREAAWERAARQSELRMAQAQLSSLQQLADDVDRRVAAGDLARSDALAARSEALVAQGAVLQAQQALARAEADWTQLTGLPPLDDPIEPPASSDTGEHHPELQRALLGLEHARQQHQASRRSRRDPLELTLSAREERSGGQEREGSVGVALRVPLGDDPRARLEEEAARTEQDVAEAQLQRLRERILLDLQASRAGMTAAEQQLAAAEARAGLLGERARLLDQSFRLGETPLPELLRALAAAREADAAVARERAALGLARARFRQSLGLLP